MELYNDPFAFLPNETIIDIAIYESIENITRLCQTSIRFNNLICNNNNFWSHKYIYDFGLPEENLNIISWKEAYQNYGAVIGFGNNGSGQLGLGDTQNRNSPTEI